MIFHGNWQSEVGTSEYHAPSTWSLGINFWKLCGLLLGLCSYVYLGNCCSAAEESETEKFQTERVHWEDRFREDTSGQYKIKGETKFSFLEVELPPNSTIAYVKTLKPKFKCGFELWPEKPEEGQQSVTQVHFQISNGWRVVLSIVRAVHEGKLFRQVVITEVNGEHNPKSPQVTELRKTPAFAISSDIERWTINYNYGLTELVCNDKRVALTFAGAFSSWLQGVALLQTGQRATLSRFEIEGQTIGYSQQQRELYQESQKVRRKGFEAEKRGDLAEAIEFEREVLAISERFNGKGSSINALFHQTIANRLGMLGLRDESRKEHVATAKILKENLGGDHPETLKEEMYLAEQLVIDGKVAEGELAMRRAVLTFVKIAGVNSTASQSMLTRLRAVLQASASKSLIDQDYESYHKLYKEIATLNKVTQGKDHWVTKNSDLEVKFAKRLLESRGEKLELLEKYLKLNMTVFPESNQLNPQASQGQQDELLQLTREILGTLHPRTADILLTIAIDRFNKGEMDTSIKMIQEGAEIFRVLSEGEDPRYINALGLLGSQLSMVQRHEEASELLAKSCRLLAEKDYSRSIEYANMKLEFGRHLIRIGDRRKAGQHLLEAFQLYRALSQPTHPNALKTCERLADIYRAAGDIDQAEKMLEYHRNLVLAAYGKDSPAYIDILSSEARHLYMRRKNDLAVQKYNEAAALTEKTYGKNSRAYEAVLNGLIDVHMARGDGAAVVKYFEERLDFELARREQLFKVYSEQEQFLRSSQDMYALDALVLLALDGHMEPSRAYDYALAYKGAVTAWQRSARIALQDPEMRERYQSLKLLEQQILQMQEQGTAKSQYEQYDKLSAKRDQLQKQLATGNKSYQVASQRARSVYIQKALSENSILVDYYEYTKPKSFLDKLFFRRAKTGLVAFVIKKEGKVQLVDLGSVTPVFQDWDTWRLGMEMEPYYKLESKEETLAEVMDSKGASLRKRIWDPLEKHLGEADTIIVSPSMYLSGCPFSALPAKEKGKYLIEEYAFATITTPRLLPELLVEPTEREKTKLLLVGDIDYNAPQRDRDPAEKVQPLNRAVQSFPKLPNATKALRPISVAFRDRFKNADFKQLRGKKASEEGVRSEIEDSDFIHFHTHGFCLSEQEILRLRNIEIALPGGTLPYYFGGIALAGGNWGISANESSDSDGILWSFEIEGLNLSSAELVTLSACQTAIGNVVPGEGQLSAQRALHVAGARSSMTALWTVSDVTTRALMEQFYRNLWKEKLSRAKSLQQAKIYMLREYDWRKHLGLEMLDPQRTPPTFWAGFVLHGDWR